MKYLRLTTCALIACLLQGASLRADESDGFDAAILIKKSVWANAANALPKARIELPSGTVTIVDASLCDSGVGQARFLVAFKVAAPQTHIVTREQDCQNSAQQIANANADTAYDIVGYATVTQTADGLEIGAVDAAARSGAVFDPALLSELRSYRKVVGPQTVDLGDGSLSEKVEATLGFLRGGLLVRIRDASMAHVLRASDIDPDFISSEGAANSEIVVAHDALSKLAAGSLAQKPIPINSTDATAKIRSYRGGAATAAVTAMISKGTHVFVGAATWSGPDLLLSDYSIKSAKECFSRNPLEHAACVAAQRVETVAAQALLQAACANCKSTRMVPLNYNNKIRFQLYGRPAYFSARTVKTTATNNALIVALNSYLGTGE